MAFADEAASGCVPVLLGNTQSDSGKIEDGRKEVVICVGLHLGEQTSAGPRIRVYCRDVRHTVLAHNADWLDPQTFDAVLDGIKSRVRQVEAKHYRFFKRETKLCFAVFIAGLLLLVGAFVAAGAGWSHSLVLGYAGVCALVVFCFSLSCMLEQDQGVLASAMKTTLDAHVLEFNAKSAETMRLLTQDSSHCLPESFEYFIVLKPDEFAFQV
eukprot:TRINITY_DN109477_c0_g1_i1.p1 TRINITY_DN109477_c0_g1~~TRINITY_DN109477_c0_g1_i1.p1  ORF type:complete len:212 (+),score=30.05 TRINITY_DN109477_c0_g1_i1:48-683(+)